MSDFHDTPIALNHNRHLTQTRLGLVMLVTFVMASTARQIRAE